jgi:hypothetical protein
LVFSPFYHPQSNGTIERFHQDYSQQVWEKCDLPDLAAVQEHSPSFFTAYRQSEHHSALAGRSPLELHPPKPIHRLPADFPLPTPFPLTVGQVHFMRRVSQASQIHLLNLDWDVPTAKPDQGVWATLQFTLTGATVRIYDLAPDCNPRLCLAEHLFPLKDEVLPLTKTF